jgi:hypothetical protein
MSELKASLDTIRKEVNSLITAIDNKFDVICKDRGIDLTAKEPEKTTTPPEQAEPSYTIENRTENIAGVDFEFQEVVPESAKIVMQTEPENDIPDVIVPDPAIGFSEMSLYGYTADDMLPLMADRAAELFNQDLTVYLVYPDNTEAMAFDTSEITNHEGIFGIERDEWINSKEYKSMGGQKLTTEGALESSFIHAKNDMFAIYQIKDGVEMARDYRFEGLDYLKERGWEVNRNNYVLVYTDTLTQSDTLDSIFQQFNIDCPKDFPGHSLSVSDVIVLQKGGEITSHYVDRFGFAELPAFLGIEKQNDITAVSNENIDLKTGGIQNMPQNEQPIYPYPAEIALQNKETDAFHASRNSNIECGEAIDKAIIDSNYATHRYDLKAAVQSVIEEYGVDRIAWVLASNINHHDWDGRLSNTNKSWAKEFDTPKPDYHLNTHLAILDGFANRFREVEKAKPSLLDTLDKTDKKIKQQKTKKPDTAVDSKNITEKIKKANKEDI